MILSPIGNSQVYNVDGTLIVGGKIWTYQEGTTTLTVTYGDKGGVTVQTNPIILNTYGLPDQPIWLQEGRRYKFVFMDEDDNLLWTYDNIQGINDFTVGGGGEEEGEVEVNSEWILGDTGVYQSSNSFYLVGDRTAIYHKFRRVKLQMLINFVYGYISSVSYDTELDRTDIDVELDDDGVINEFLSNTFYSILSYAPQAYPNFLPMAQWQKKGDTLTIQGGYVNVWDHSGNFAHVSGSGNIIDMGISPQEGAQKYLYFDDIDVTIFNNAKIHTPQGVNLNIIQGDIVEVFAGEGGINLVTHLMSNAPTEVATWDSPLQTRQTVLTGPYKVQNASTENAPYYEIPTQALTSNNSFGYIVTTSGVYPGYSTANVYSIFDKNTGSGLEYYNNNWTAIEFPENFYVDKFSCNNWMSWDGQGVKNMDYCHVYTSLDGTNWDLTLNSWNVDSTGTVTISIAQKLIRFIRVVGWNTAQGQYTFTEFRAFGYKASSISIPTVSTLVESLIKNTVYNQISPIMSSPVTSGYTVSASSEKGVASAWKAFDGGNSTYWESTGATNEWVRMIFPAPQIINRVKLTAPGVTPNEMPERWVIQGSNDGTSYVDLKEWLDTDIWAINDVFYFDFQNDVAYTYYRIFIKTNQGGASVAIGEASFQQRPIEAVYGSIDINLSETQTVVSMADGFTNRGQNDFTVALPTTNETVPIMKGAQNYIYLRRNPSTGQITYEAKQQAPIYGTYRPDYITDMPVLLRGDNIASPNSIIDSYGNKNITTVNSVTVSSVLKKFGAGSLLFSSAGSKVIIPRNMGITTSRWSIDFWWNPQSLIGAVDLISTNPIYSILFGYGRTATKLSVYLSSNGSAWNIASGSPGLKTNFAINTWYYINFVFTGSRYLVFVDGVQDIEVASTSNIWQISALNVGGHFSETNTASGYIDEFRFRPGMVNFYSELTPILPTVSATYVKPWFFNITQMKGYEIEEDGTQTSVQMVCLGEAFAKDATSYNASTITYAYNGRKSIQWSEFNPVVDSWIELPHNIGTELIISSINLNSKTATSPYSNQAIIPIEAVGMYGGSATWGGIPMGKTVDKLSIKIRYPASNSADYVAIYSGNQALGTVSGDAISMSATFMRAF